MTVVAVLMGGLLFFGCSSSKEITILHFNDLHANILPLKTSRKSKVKEAGLARLLGTIQRMKTPETIVAFGGDFIQGTSFSTSFRGKVTAQLIGPYVDIMVPGLHDFDYGWKNLVELCKKNNIKLLSSNIVNKQGDSFSGGEFYIREINGVKIGFFAITMVATEVLLPKKNIIGLKFEPVDDTAVRMVKKLQDKGCDVVIALSHNGFEEDKKIARALFEKGLDFIIGGRSNTVLKKGFLVLDTYITQAGQKGEYLGKLSFVYDRDKDICTDVNASLIRMSKDVPEDSGVKAKIVTYKKQLDKKLQRDIGQTKVFLDGVRVNVRTHESNLGNYIADAMVRFTGADMALLNGGSIRDSIKKGTIKVADVLNVLPYNNQVVTVRLAGKHIKRMIQKSSAKKPPAGSFLQVSKGLQYKIKGRVLQEVTFRGQPIDDNRVYKVATTDFLAGGGDNYVEFKNDKTPKTTGSTMAEMLIWAITRDKVLNPNTEQRIVRVGQNKQ